MKRNDVTRTSGHQRLQVFDNVIGAIGNTPIVRLNSVVAPKAMFFAKLEFLNPGGSIKDRIGAWMIEDAERKGLVRPGATIVESTSGNTGVGLALAAIAKGYRCLFVVPDKSSREKVNTLRSLGVEVVVTPSDVSPGDSRSYYETARRLAAELPNAYYVNQHNNCANREAHYHITGPEILEQMPNVDVFVAGIGTGGTVCGVGRFLKQHRPGIQIVAVDPVGSVVCEYFRRGSVSVAARPYQIEGIGEDMIPANYDLSVVDDIVQVGDDEAFRMTRDVIAKEGLLCGVSGGAAVAGALKWIGARRLCCRRKKILIVLPDGMKNYLSRLFDDTGCLHGIRERVCDRIPIHSI